jgi:hypothetical protein
MVSEGGGSLPKRVVDVPTYLDTLARAQILAGLYDNFDHLVAIALQKQLKVDALQKQFKADEDKIQAWTPRERE